MLKSYLSVAAGICAASASVCAKFAFTLESNTLCDYFLLSDDSCFWVRSCRIAYGQMPFFNRVIVYIGIQRLYEHIVHFLQFLDE